jgi:hypothetical protein
MRPKNSDIMEATAGEMLVEFLLAMREGGVTLSLGDVRNLVDRAQARIDSLQQEKRAGGNGNGARAAQ